MIQNYSHFIIHYLSFLSHPFLVLRPASFVLHPSAVVHRLSSVIPSWRIWMEQHATFPTQTSINQSTTKKNKSLSDLFLISPQKPKEHTTRHLLNPPSNNMFPRSVPVLSEHDFKMVLLAKSARSSWIMHGPYFSACTLMSINSSRSANYRADPNGLGFLIYTQVMRCSFLIFSQKQNGPFWISNRDLISLDFSSRVTSSMKWLHLDCLRKTVASSADWGVEHWPTYRRFLPKKTVRWLVLLISWFMTRP